MVKIICNRCGADITARKSFGEVAVRLHENPDFDTLLKWVAGNNKDEHYCRECAEEIARFAHTPPKAEHGTQAEGNTGLAADKADSAIKAAEADTKNIRRRVDYGKIMALRDAGWDNGKIADEMHMSKASVSQAVSKYKKMRMEGHLDEAENKGAVSDNQGTI